MILLLGQQRYHSLSKKTIYHTRAIPYLTVSFVVSAASASARLSMTLRHALTIAAYGPRQTARASGRLRRIGRPLGGEQQGILKIIRERKWC